MGDVYLCIHGHFYQPPRENPWLGIIEAQPTARPYHDWNERICRECYAPNGRARVLGERGLIARLVNNYEFMSFNFGPTLLSWLEQAYPKAYADILRADYASQARFQGHGNALAQVYNHIIMPLATRRDKLTQIRWGKADFKHRFGRDPEGMWLAETAVDNETLNLLVDEGIKFTILSPDQARKIRPLAGQRKAEPWVDVSGGRIDPRRPYRLFLEADGRKFIDIFFYDGPTSRAVAYERLLTSGAGFLARIKQAAGEETAWPRLVTLATDGETYGHHFQFGEMALSWLFDHLDNSGPFKISNFGAFLEKFPPQFEVQVLENTSWSCAHGIERWRSDCGCHVGGQAGWNQAWRTPLRQGLDWLAGRLSAHFEKHGQGLFKDPWAARDDYISVILTPTESAREDFLKRQALQRLSGAKRAEAFSILEAQLMSLYMFTSCGWFFDDIAGLEPTQNLKYAARAMDLTAPFGLTDLKTGLLGYLEKAKSNAAEYQDGAEVFLKVVEKSRITPTQAAAHFAMRLLVDDVDLKACPVAARVKPIRQRKLSGPGLAVAVGHVLVGEPLTGQDFERLFLSIHLGGLDLKSMIGEKTDGFNLETLVRQISPAVDDSSPELIIESFRRLAPEAVTFELKDLFPDSRSALVWILAQEVRDYFRDWIREFFDLHQNLLQNIEETGAGYSEVPAFIYRLVVGDQLASLLEGGLGESGLDWEAIRGLAVKAKTWGVPLNAVDLTARAQNFVQGKMDRLIKSPETELGNQLIDFINLARDLSLGLDLWSTQNTFFDFYRKVENHLPPGLQSTMMDLGRVLGFLV